MTDSKEISSTAGFYNNDIDKFKIANDKNEANKQLKKLCEELFKTEVLITNNFLNDENYYKFFQIKQVKNILQNSDITKTVEIYFENAMNTSVASMAGYMHRNTMVYRLQKIKNTIGLDIRNFSDAVIYKNILSCYKVMFKD